MLQPIRAIEAIIEEYRDYLLTEFRAKDPALKQALEREIDRPRFLAQEPFYQAHRPFKAGKSWSDLPIDKKFAKALAKRAHNTNSYLHQSDAIDYLLGPTPSSVVVTTGTGSGKTEAFLVPVVQNAIEDAVAFNKSGLTAILVYPMNALANDQDERIKEYLEESGFTGTVRVAKYDRGTKQSERESLRRNPPHILLTNYMMLEYLLVRPADRDAIFANHRCRFIVLDEVHTYRGALGSNIALLMRRLKGHLKQAKQDWNPNPEERLRARRFPTLLPIGTSATIKSDGEGLSKEEARRLRDREVQSFFGKLTGIPGESIKVLGEELQEITVPADASYAKKALTDDVQAIRTPDDLRRALCRLAGVPETTEILEAARRCRLLWDLNIWLIRKPMSVGQIIGQVIETVPGRDKWSRGEVGREVALALHIGATVPEEVIGNLKLRAHQFVRGGWQFYRCVDPACGKLYPKAEEHCECGRQTAPLYLCRNCGADYLRFTGDDDAAGLQPSDDKVNGKEWMLYQYEKFGELHDEDEGEVTEEADPLGGRMPRQMRGRLLKTGSLDIRTFNFSENRETYPLKVILAPARNRCLCCGNTAGNKDIVSPVRLGTSAAVKVLSEGTIEALVAAHRDDNRQDDKERLLIFSDSRQDASHQARFIRFASRYDRFRRRIVSLLTEEGPLSVQRSVELLSDLAAQNRDNPNLPDEPGGYLPTEMRQRIQVYEEAPLLDEISLNAGFRATIINLGLVEVQYEQLAEYVAAEGKSLQQQLGLKDAEQLTYICRCLLDKARVLGCLNRDMLTYHPSHPRVPEYFYAAEWERKVKMPKGLPAGADGNPIGGIDPMTVPAGITINNVWRRSDRGRVPAFQRIFTELLKRFGGIEPEQDHLMQLLSFLKRAHFLEPMDLFGYRDSCRLLQVNHQRVILKLTEAATRFHCNTCGNVVSGAREGFPCPSCHGKLVRFPDAEVDHSRYVRRIRAASLPILTAEEHTAQVTNERRLRIEENFKGPVSQSRLNILACSPTLEMGIDVGGLDAVVMRNIPPRPDNYAQRGGRAGRRQRIGLVIGYVRATPHDQYFYDHPEEMIAGEVAPPQMSLGNRDIILRHLGAIIFGAAEPGLAGKMVEYISPTGEIQQAKIDELIQAVNGKTGYALELAHSIWGEEVFSAAGLTDQDLQDMVTRLPDRIQDVFNRTSRQVQELRTVIESFSESLRRGPAANRAAQLVGRLLGIQASGGPQRDEADDRSSGYPLRRFAEFGILPGYEFPDQPASLRLLNDLQEDDLITVGRRFGITQYQPEAQVFARARRWVVIGLDVASPWNPYGTDQGWNYRVCADCGLRYAATDPKCGRCGSTKIAPNNTAVEYAGFLAKRQEMPILDEEERYAMHSYVVGHPQWNGDVIGRWRVGPGWSLMLKRREKIIWLNEGSKPTASDFERGVPILHREAKGFLLCPSCGHILKPQLPEGAPGERRRRPRQSGQQDPFGHSQRCDRRGQPELPIAISTEQTVEILRLLVPVPAQMPDGAIEQWGLSLGFSLRAGMRHRYTLDGSEIDFLLEGPWASKHENAAFNLVALSFIDAHIGGSGYLDRIAREFDKVARDSIQYLQHDDCETACYRCLKSYQNQRFHQHLNWPRIMSDLETLAGTPVETRPLLVSDIDDPRPWLEAYAAGVGSPLELKFLRLFEANGIKVDKQVPIGPQDDGKPISLADFVVSGKRVAIYIDGAAFHCGANLRRDRFIRDRLRNGTPPWKVVELRAVDLARGSELRNEI